MPAQLNIFLLLFGGLQGLLVSLFLIRKKLYRSGYIFLLLYFGVMLMQITLKVMSKAWLIQNWAALYWMSYLLPLLYGPLVFLFVRRLLLNKSFRSVDLLHFLPFVFLAFGFILPYGDFFSQKTLRAFYGVRTELIIQVISLLLYHGWAMHSWYRHKNVLRSYFSDTHRLQANWVRQFIIASFLVSIVIATAIYLLYMNYPRGAEFRYGFAALTIFIYWVSYTALSRPSVFSLMKENESLVAPLLPKMVVHRPVKKYSNSGLSEKDMEAIRETLQKVMAEQKPYLDPSLTINHLAELVKCNRHHLSQVLNESLERSFYDYINHYRVEEARQLLLDHTRRGHKIAAVAYDAGFNSLSTFNDVFKKMAGVTPSQFKKNSQGLSKRIVSGQ